QNLEADSMNSRFFDCLQATTGQKLPNDPAQWWSWWKKYNEDQTEKPTSYYVTWYSEPMYRTQVVPTHSCFVQGTPVETESGRKPIDTVLPGDRVLSQNLETGELAWKIVQNTSVTKLSKLRELVVGNETIVATPGHPFWVNGSGWKMAKELQVGDRIHTLQGFAEIKSNSEPARQDTVYNLVIADFSTYFVGEVGALVHDIPYRQPTLAKVPGLVDVGR
ncbi:MAG: HINT domain-containing protein, partial [Planctomycetales bacterium]|nr:HINT domain-containing protein [Planctomycetales bacterium]